MLNADRVTCKDLRLSCYGVSVLFSMTLLEDHLTVCGRAMQHEDLEFAKHLGV